jgi:ABC-type protease/lipase transport system fused ATPase/permease subunit
LRPKLVVLDEPNSNLDEEGEVALNNAVEILKNNGSTVVLVSHRKGVLPLVDLLAVVVAGTIAEFGPPSELLGAPPPSQSSAAANSTPRPEKAPAQTVPIKFPNPQDGA